MSKNLTELGYTKEAIAKIGQELFLELLRNNPKNVDQLLSSEAVAQSTSKRLAQSYLTLLEELGVPQQK